MLLNIIGGEDLGLHEVNEAAELVSEAAHPDANIIFGAVIDEKLEEEVSITVIATGFEQQDRKRQEDKKVGRILEQTMNGNDDDDLDIPTFLRRGR